MRLLWFLAGGAIIAVALPYLMYREAVKGDKRAVRNQQLFDTFAAGQSLAIYYNRCSLSMTVAAASLIGCAPFIIVIAIPGMGVADWTARPGILFLFLVLFLFWLPAWDALRRILSNEPALVLSANTLKIAECETEIAWSEIANLKVWAGRSTYVTLQFHKRTFRNSFLVRSRSLTLRPDYYHDAGILLVCLRNKISPVPLFQKQP